MYTSNFLRRCRPAHKWCDHRAAITMAFSDIHVENKVAGTSWSKRSLKWRACIRIDFGTFHIGYYEDQFQAGNNYVAVKSAIQEFKKLSEHCKNHKEKVVLFRDWKSKIIHVCSRDKSSKFSGVMWSDRAQKWVTHIYIGRILYQIANYKKDEERQASNDYQIILSHKQDIEAALSEIPDRIEKVRYFKSKVCELLGYSLISMTSDRPGLSWNQKDSNWEVYAYIDNMKFALRRYDPKEIDIAKHHLHLLMGQRDRLQKDFASLSNNAERRSHFRQVMKSLLGEQQLKKRGRRKVTTQQTTGEQGAAVEVPSSPSPVHSVPDNSSSPHSPHSAIKFVSPHMGSLRLIRLPKRRDALVR